MTLLLPDPDQFVYTYVRKEAVLSSQIEGTQSSLSDLLLFENEAAPGVPSLYLKQNRDDYYDHLQRVRSEGAWEEWLRFFLEGVIEVAESTTELTQRIVTMIERDRQRIQALGRAAPTAMRVHDLVSRYVVVRATRAAQVLEISEPPVYGAIARLEELGILREVSGRQRGKIFVYDEYLALLNEGTTKPA